MRSPDAPIVMLPGLFLTGSGGATEELAEGLALPPELLDAPAFDDAPELEAPPVSCELPEQAVRASSEISGAAAAARPRMRREHV